MIYLKLSVTTAILAVLTACGNSNDAAMQQLSSFPGVDQVTPAESRGQAAKLLFTEPDGNYTEIADLTYLAADIIALESQSPDFDFAAPTLASATYDGLIGTTLNRSNETVVGNMTLNANFAQDTVSGSASGFSVFREDFTGESFSGLQRERTLAGTLPITNGVISTTDVQLELFARPTTITKFDAVMDGTLNDGDNTYNITSDIEAGFAKANDQNIVLGAVTGTATDMYFGAQNFEGVIVGAERE